MSFKKKKILIVSASIGTGHMQAAKAIEEYYHTYYDNVTIHHADILEKDSLSLDYVIKETYIKMIDIFPLFYDLLYRMTQHKGQGTVLQIILSWLLKSRMLRLYHDIQPDVIVFTHPFPCGAAAILKRQKEIDVPFIGVITDFAIHKFWLYPQVDAYCVGAKELIDPLVQSGIEASKIVHTGMPIRQAYNNRPERYYTLDMHRHALVMGGGLGLGAILRVIKDLSRSKTVQAISVVAGHNEALYESLLELKESSPIQMDVYAYTTEIPKLMSEASLLLTKPGGLTCREAIAMGLPMVFYSAIPGQEEENASHFENLECARWVKDIDQIASVVDHLFMHPEELQHMSDVSASWQDNGVMNIGRTIAPYLWAEEEQEQAFKQQSATII